MTKIFTAISLLFLLIENPARAQKISVISDTAKHRVDFQIDGKFSASDRRAE